MCALPQRQNALKTEPSCRRPGREVCLRLFPGEWALSWCCPHHVEVGLGSIQGETKKGPRPHNLFPKDFPPQALRISFLLLKYEAAALGHQEGCKSQQRGWDHFARLPPSPQDLLARFLENCVIFNQSSHLQKPGWVGYKGLQPQRPCGGQDPDQKEDRCSPAGPQLFVEAGRKVPPACGPGGTNQPSLE